jgi:hypothetical protein
VVISLCDSPSGVFVIPSNEQLAFAEDVSSILNVGEVDHVSHVYTFSRAGFVPSFCGDEQEPEVI